MPDLGSSNTKLLIDLTGTCSKILLYHSDTNETLKLGQGHWRDIIIWSVELNGDYYLNCEEICMSKTITANQAKVHHCVHSAHISCMWKVLMERTAWVSVNVLEMFPGSKHGNSCDKPIYLYMGMTVCVAVTVSMLLCTHVMLIPPLSPASLAFL